MQVMIGTRHNLSHSGIVNHMRSNGVIVDDIAKEVGGKQSFTITDGIGKRRAIPLKFNGDIMTVACRMPTDEKIMALKIN